MTIVPLERVTIAGLIPEKDQLLDALQERGCVELIPLRTSTASETDSKPRPRSDSSSESRTALKFLLSCPQHRRQVTDEARFDATDVEQQALVLQRRIQDLETERDRLLVRITNARPWGEFQFPPLEELGGLRLWFYVVPHNEMAKLQDLKHPWQVVRRDNRFSYVVVVSEKEPRSFPVPRVHIGATSPADLARRLEEVELALEDAQAERAYLTRWCLLLARSLDQLDDQQARAAAASETWEQDPLFAVQAWVPQEHASELAEYAAQQGFMFERHPPTPGETPPTLMRNRPRLAAGEDLVNFYMTPGYWTWDPSSVVLISFALFFGMILADAGYAAVLGVGLLFYWRRMGTSESGRRFRPMLALIVAMSFVYGVLVGSYFGLTPGNGSLLGAFHLLDMSNSRLMMGVSVLVGGLHVILANLMEAKRHTTWPDRFAPLGWAAAVCGGLTLGIGAAIPSLAVLKPIGGGMTIVGLLLVIGYTAPHEPLLSRGLQGLLGLTKITSAFGDVLSYLRLFALGLASASLAVAFNDMASGIHSSMPRLGLLLALLVLALGHALNLLLGISSGVIHGLRLNVIEFFNWGLKDEGRRFAPFRRKDGSLWK